jgi:hypothetical protein
MSSNTILLPRKLSITLTTLIVERSIKPAWIVRSIWCKLYCPESHPLLTRHLRISMLPKRFKAYQDTFPFPCPWPLWSVLKTLPWFMDSFRIYRIPGMSIISWLKTSKYLKLPPVQTG